MRARAEPDLTDVLREVRRIDVQTRRLVTGAMAGGYLSVFRGSGIEFDEVREYVEGDDPRAVDWNVTARVGRPFVKTYVDERDLTVLFVLDLSLSMDGGFGIWSARETAVRVCACLAFSAVRNGDRVGLVGFSDRIDGWVPPRKGVRHVLRIVRDGLMLEGHGSEAALEPALEFASHVVRRHAVVFVLSDFLTEGWARPLGLCARRHDVVAVRLLTPELHARDVGLLRVRDPESGAVRVIDARHAGARAGYARTVAAWRFKTERVIRRAGADVMDVPVPRTPRPDAVALPILRFFRAREERRVRT